MNYKVFRLCHGLFEMYCSINKQIINQQTQVERHEK